MFHPDGPTFWELAEQALSSTERGYDLLAPKFDVTPFRTPTPILNAVAKPLRELGPFESALDICCGTGAGMEVLKPICRRVVGLDFSRGMLDVARRNVSPAPGDAELTFVRGDALAMPFGAAFDLAVCFGALGHIPQRDESRFIAEVARVLRPGGRFVFVTSCSPPWWSLRFWLPLMFNLAMAVRNAVLSPPFIMYYLTFLLPSVRRLLQMHGFEVEERELVIPELGRGWYLVIATRHSNG